MKKNNTNVFRDLREGPRSRLGPGWVLVGHHGHELLEIDFAIAIGVQFLHDLVHLWSGLEPARWGDRFMSEWKKQL